MVKLKKETVVTKTATGDKKQSKKAKIWSIVRPAIGAALIALIVSVYLQSLPIVMVFIGAYLGVDGQVDLSPEDLMLWGGTAFGVILLTLYGMHYLFKTIHKSLLKRK